MTGLRKNIGRLIRQGGMLAVLVLISFPADSQNRSRRNSPPQRTVTAAATADTVYTSLPVAARNYGDSIVVRWAPDSPTAWLLLQESGYILRRTVFTGQGSDLRIVDSSSIVIKPWTIEQWGASYRSSRDTLRAVAAQLAFGKSPELPETGDGNLLGSIIQKNEEQKNRHTFALLLSDLVPAVATGFGFRYVEKNVGKELQYLFSVIPAPSGHLIQSKPGRMLVRGAEVAPRDSVTALTAVSGDRVIHLLWQKPPVHKAAFSGFFIERSENGRTYMRLSRLPYLPASREGEAMESFRFEDSVRVNYRPYYYRIVGVNAFGDYSNPSNVVQVMGIDLTGPSAPVIRQIENVKGDSKIHLKWDKKIREPDFRGYVVGRSNNLDGPFNPISSVILGPQTSEFTDNSPVAGQPNYYIVAAVDTAGNSGRSLPAYVQLEDHVPPAKPTGLRGNIDTLGRVTVRWNLGRENDLSGYKLFFRNAADHQFIPLTGELLEDSVFVDTIPLRTLTSKIYYQLVAFDYAMNASPPSDVLELTKPDRVAPVQATIHSFLVTDRSVTIRWNPSVSIDVAQQKIFRRALPTGNWEEIARISKADSVYQDQKTVSGTHYEYAIETIDQSGLSSGKSFGLKVYAYQKGYSGEISNFTATYATDQKKVVLKWKPPAGNLSYYILYSGRPDEGMGMTGNINGDQQTFEEPVVKGSYKYAIKGIFANGEETAMSEIKTVVVP